MSRLIEPRASQAAKRSPFPEVKKLEWIDLWAHQIPSGNLT